MSEVLHTLPLGFKKAVGLHAGLGVLLVKGDAQHRRVCGIDDLRSHPLNLALYLLAN